MQQTTIILDDLHLVGLTARTNNKNEMLPEKAKIGVLIGQYTNNQAVVDIYTGIR